jgi:hypothetical protein
MLASPPPTCWLDRAFSATTPTKEQPVNFQVRVIEWWLGHGPADVVNENIDYYAPQRRREIRKQLRILSRTFAPDELADFERRANERLGRPAVFSDGLLECHYSVEVTPDEVYQDHLRKTWEADAQAEADHRLKERALEHLEPLRNRWLEFLRDLEADPLGPHAMQLANNPDKLSEILERHASEQKDQQDRLSDICNATSNAYREMDVFDFVMETDGALTALMRHLGIDQPAAARRASQSNEPPAASSNGSGPANGADPHN